MPKRGVRHPGRHGLSVARRTDAHRSSLAPACVVADDERDGSIDRVHARWLHGAIGGPILDAARTSHKARSPPGGSAKPWQVEPSPTSSAGGAPTRHRRRTWAVIVEPDVERTCVLAVTAYRAGASRARDSRVRQGHCRAYQRGPGVVRLPRAAGQGACAAALRLLRITPAGVDVAESTGVEAFPEGVGFSGDGREIFVGNFASSSLSVVSLAPDGRVIKKAVIALPGPPASVRIGSQ